MGATSQWRAPPGWRRTRLQVFAIYGRSCWRCGGHAGTVGHVVAVALGGDHSLQNLRPECQPCNSSDGARIKNRMYPQPGPRRRRGAPVARRKPPQSSRTW